MNSEAQVAVAGPSRAVLAIATAALVALTSGATAFVVLSGTGSVGTAGPTLGPRPPVASPSAGRPVVVLPPGALGLPVPQLPPAPRRGGAAAATSDAGGSTVVLAAPQALLPLAPLLPDPLLPDLLLPDPALPGAPARPLVPGRPAARADGPAAPDAEPVAPDAESAFGPRTMLVSSGPRESEPDVLRAATAEPAAPAVADRGKAPGKAHGKPPGRHGKASGTHGKAHGKAPGKQGKASGKAAGKGSSKARSAPRRNGDKAARSRGHRA